MLSFKKFVTTKSEDFQQEILEQFVEFCAENLELEELPLIHLVKDGTMSNTFGCYGNGQIKLNILNRHPLDILRTLAHEMVHYKQDCDGVLHERSGEDGSEHENEANSLAGVLMREFGRQNPDLFNSGPILENVGLGIGLGMMVRNYKLKKALSNPTIIIKYGNKFRNHEGKIVDEHGIPTGESDGKENYYKELHKQHSNSVSITVN